MGAFLDFTAINLEWIFLLQVDNFCEFDRRENEAPFILLIVELILIDRASRELSNGCHIVNFD